VNKGADPNLPGKGGDTPLIAAARVGYDDAAEWLLGQGAKSMVQTAWAKRPLIIAVQQRQVAMVNLLLAAGANPDKTDQCGGSVRARLCRAGFAIAGNPAGDRGEKAQACGRSRYALRRASGSICAASRRAARRAKAQQLGFAPRGASGRCAASRAITAS
jgi:ankyrin repeat protein